MSERHESAADRIVRLMGMASACTTQGRQDSVRIGNGAVVAGGNVRIFVAPPAARPRGFAESRPNEDRPLLADMIALCGNQLGDTRQHVPHMIATYGTSQIDRLSDVQLRELADWAFRRAVGRGLTAHRSPQEGESTA